ncbi:hypothetical protein H072_140 [Dactylellina haptotyla CBS 200.50]|uniref:Uncharacterized protein n=1 Tax=Dactylellina haptotyla (strain CBS 200.50) TaxID=1284197 RepID=S8AY19_DACHA|nr:hypothetical protein H072_140 [Dactylellina haptotyla CBS 200.50]
MIDLKTIASFPLLEHLGVRVIYPESGVSWVLTFHSLKSLYLIGKNLNLENEEAKEEGEFPERFLAWFAPEDVMQSENPNLQVILLEQRGYQSVRSIRPYTFLAYFRECGGLFNFKTQQQTLSDVRHWYPEVRDFISTYGRYFVYEKFRKRGGNKDSSRPEDPSRS